MRLLRPLRHRDFAVLFAAQSVSLLGDGIFGVAATWQAYALWNSPTAMAVLGIAWTLPFLAFVAAGGVVSDRADRRRVMLVADVVRGAVLVALAALALTGSIVMWKLAALFAVYAVGDALFAPAFGAIVPDLVPESDLVQANALAQSLRPAALLLAGPAIGGVIVATQGTGVAFLVDAITFVASGAAVLALRTGSSVPHTAGTSPRAELVAALRFVRAERWLSAMLATAALVVLLMWGPCEILLPFLVKNALGGDAADVGLIFAAGGVGALIAAPLLAQRGEPRRPSAVMYATWALSVLCVAGDAFTGSVWEVMAIAAAATGLDAIASVLWGTLTQRHVPREMRGRIAALTSLAAFGLLPLSYAFTAPLAGVVGVRATLVGAGVLGALVTIAFRFAPGALALDVAREAPGRCRTGSCP